MLKELKDNCNRWQTEKPYSDEGTPPVNVVGAIWQRIETLAAQTKLKQLGERIKQEFQDIFEPIPHTKTLPTNIYCRIRLKDVSKTIAT